MKAVIISSYGEPGNLVLAERPVPIPADHEVLLRVHAAGINRPDIFQRKGHYPAPPGVVPDVPGLEVAGIIEACGRSVQHWTPGDRVCALVPGGGYAEYVAVDAGHCLALPEHVDFVHGACLPETVFTVWHNVFQRGQLQAGERLLVHGGGGGIGTTAIQLAVQFGATVYATAGSDKKCRFCEQLGAARCINYRQADFAERLSDARIDVVLDSIGTPYFERHLSLLADGGRLVFINAMGGRHAEVNIADLMRRRLTLTGSTLRARDAAFKHELRNAVAEHVWPLLASERFKPVVDQTFPLARAAEAHRVMESGNFIGKLVLVV